MAYSARHPRLSAPVPLLCCDCKTNNVKQGSRGLLRPDVLPSPFPETVGLLAPQYRHQRHDQLCFLSDGLSCLGYHCSETHDASITKTVISLLHSEVVSCLGYHYSQTHDANIIKTVLCLLHLHVLFSRGYYYTELHDANITKTVFSLFQSEILSCLGYHCSEPHDAIITKTSSLCFT